MSPSPTSNKVRSVQQNYSLQSFAYTLTPCCPPCMSPITTQADSTALSRTTVSSIAARFSKLNGSKPNKHTTMKISTLHVRRAQHSNIYRKSTRLRVKSDYPVRLHMSNAEGMGETPSLVKHMTSSSWSIKRTRLRHLANRGLLDITGRNMASSTEGCLRHQNFQSSK